MNQKRLRSNAILLLAVLPMLLPARAAAEEILIAVAANFTAPMNAIAAAFEADTGHSVSIAYGSSGRLFAQISNGAPFHLFFSADQDKPQQLVAAGLADQASLSTYATGALLLWSASLEVTGPEILGSQQYQRLALANPRLAPYGQAAVETLTALAMQELTEAKWVQGENIAQTFQFVASGNAQLGFIARSQVVESAGTDFAAEGSGWPVPAEMHAPIHQDAVLLNNANDCSACRDFLAFVKTPAMRRLITRYGYSVTP